MDLIKYNTDHTIYPFGFINLGNTCYFNALIQSLLSCPSLIEISIHNIEILQNNPIGNNILKMVFLTKNLNSLYKTNTTNQNTKKIEALYKQLNRISAETWKYMIKTIHEKSPEMAKFALGQQCSREGFHLLINNMEEISGLQRLFNHRYRNEIYCSNCSQWVSKVEEDNNIFEIEPTLTLEQLEQFQEMDNLYGKKRDLNNFLLEQNNYVDADYICPECKTTGEKFRTQKLVMVPEILFVVAKKYNNELKKEHIYTEFPKKLEFRGINTTLNYEAVAQIEHSGELNAGHYWAICRRKNGWYRLNDMSVEPAEFKPTENTYIVLYHYM